METLKAKWQEMGLYRRILLAVMLAEIVGFLIAYVIVVNRPGLEYSGALLYPHTEGELQIYEGKIDGEPARFAVSPEGEISYQWGEYTYGPWQVVADPTAVPDGFREKNGLEIRRGDEVIFRGIYSPHSFNLLIDENGDPVRDTFSVGSVGGGATLYYVTGQEVTREEWYEPGLGALARIVLTPELTRAHPPGESASLVWDDAHRPAEHLPDLLPPLLLPPGSATPCAECGRCGALGLLHRHGEAGVVYSGRGVPGAVRHEPDRNHVIPPNREKFQTT